MTAQGEISPVVDDIEGYFDRFGWTFDRVDASTFRTGFSGSHGTYTMLVRVTEHWVVFTINPLMHEPAAGYGSALLKILASANHTVNIAKLGIDPDRDVFITIEMPSEAFSYSQFDDAVSALAHYADQVMLLMLQARRVDEINRRP